MLEIELRTLAYHQTTLAYHQTTQVRVTLDILI